MPPCRRHSAVMRCLLSATISVALFAGSQRVAAQGVPTVQQAEFRSQGVGDQVDQIPLGGTLVPTSGLGAVVGSLQTRIR